MTRDSAHDPASSVPIEGESRGSRVRRRTRQTFLHGTVVVVVIILVLLVILVAENTRSVKVGWIFGYSHVSLVFLVLFAAVLGWLLGIATAMLVRRRSSRMNGDQRPS